MSIGVPIKVLHEAEGHIVTCETNTGEVYRGKLVEAEDNMNCQMASITVTYRDGRVAQLENVYIRGSKIRFMILPDMLKNAPMFKKAGTKTATASAGRGKSAILRAQGKVAAFSCVAYWGCAKYLLVKQPNHNDIERCKRNRLSPCLLNVDTESSRAGYARNYSKLQRLLIACGRTGYLPWIRVLLKRTQCRRVVIVPE